MQRRSWLGFIGSCVLAVMCATAAVAQPTFVGGGGGNTLSLSSPPVLVAPGDVVSVCGVNLTGITTFVGIGGGGTTLDLSEQIVDSVTGAILAQQTINLPPLGSVAHPSNPCVQYSVPSTSVSVLGPGQLLTGLIAATAQSGTLVAMIAPGISASLNVYTPSPTPTVTPSNIRTVPLLPPQPCIF
jgi:hypothetical protein